MNSRHSAHLAVFNDSKQILLVKRKDVPVWVIPGGTGEKGEIPLQTALREFTEETGAGITSKGVQLVAKYTPVKQGGIHKYLFTTTRKKLRGFKTTSESSDFGFFSIDNLPEAISLYEQRKIHEAFLACCDSELVRQDDIFYLYEIIALLSKPMRLIRLVYLYIKAKRS
jgi:8-oxo-dGTP pyrophosphatase MutT (NUDIX family)